MLRTFYYEQRLSQSGMTTSPPQLATDVFLCLADNRVVFLDLRRNQYLCLNQHSTQTAISLLFGFARPDENPQMEITDNGDKQRIVKVLTARGLLAQGFTSGKETAPVRIQTPAHTLLEGSSSTPPIRSSYWATFLYASLKASWKLRCYSMQRTVQSVRNRKYRDVRSRTADHETLRELVAIFQHLRPFYIRKYLCLYDSLALVEFLAHYRFYPEWVFGVMAEPFGAHCWLQERDYLLNDAVERVGMYTPIMVI